MSLSTHIVFAALATKPFIETQNPFVIFIVAFASHFIIDAVPHFDYKLISLTRSKTDGVTIKRSYKSISRDLFYIGIDVLIGSAILFATYSFINIRVSILTLLAVIIGAILPDALQVIYWLFKNSPIKYLQKFHEFIHASIAIKSPLIGVPAQIIIVAISIYLVIV